MTAQRHAAARAKALLANPHWLILDTETTGLGDADQVIQICLTTPTGRTLLDTLIRPTVPVEPLAFATHGISHHDLQIAPTYPQIDPLLNFHLTGNHIIAYNAPFDIRLLAQTARAHGLLPPRPAAITCAMQLYTDYTGSRQHIRLPDARHNASDDTRAVLRLLERIAGFQHTI